MGPVVARGRLIRVAAAVLAGLVAAALLGSVRGAVGPFEITVAWRPAPEGLTRLLFPPLGEVEARTHPVPAALTVRLESIDFARLRRLVDQAAADQSAAVQGLLPATEHLAGRLFARLLAVAALGGAAAGIVLASGLPNRSRVRRAAALGLAAAATVGALAGLTRATFDVGAFRSPTYRGALEEVPWLVRTVQSGLAEFEALDERLRRLTENVYDMYRRVESLEPPLAPGGADVTILHVSDFHNHPTAAGLVVQVAHAFDVDVVVNTGDLTDFGTRLEAELLGELARLEVPHLLVSGNHESPAVLDHLALLPHVELLDGRQVEVAGIRIAGMGDPGAQTDSAESLPPAEARELARGISDALAHGDERLDVVAVHNHRVGLGIRPGLVPLVLFGHSHSAEVRFREGTTYVNAGTTGGAGVRGVEARPAVPITLAVIHLRREEEGVRVLAVDTLELSPVAGGFTMRRQMAPVPAETRRGPAAESSGADGGRQATGATRHRRPPQS